MPSMQAAFRGLRPVAVLLPMFVSAACAVSPSSPSKVGATGIDSVLAYCADSINEYRARISQPALSRSPELEVFATQAAEHDAGLGVPHQFFFLTQGGGVARAENQLLRWKGYTPRDVIKNGLIQMWAEGPAGSHYRVLAGAYTEVGCGVFTSGSEVTISQDFR